MAEVLKKLFRSRASCMQNIVRTRQGEERRGRSKTNRMIQTPCPCAVALRWRCFYPPPVQPETQFAVTT